MRVVVGGCRLGNECVYVEGGGGIGICFLRCDNNLYDGTFDPVCLFIIISLNAFDVASFIKLSGVCACIM